MVVVMSIVWDVNTVHDKNAVLTF